MGQMRLCPTTHVMFPSEMGYVEGRGYLRCSHCHAAYDPARKEKLEREAGLI